MACCATVLSIWCGVAFVLVKHMRSWISTIAPVSPNQIGIVDLHAINKYPNADPATRLERLSYTLHLNFNHPSKSPELPKGNKTTRCGGVASALSISTVAIGIMCFRLESCLRQHLLHQKQAMVTFTVGSGWHPLDSQPTKAHGKNHPDG